MDPPNFYFLTQNNKCVEEFMLSEDAPMHQTKAMKAYLNTRKAVKLATDGKFKIDKNHRFKVHLSGLLGKLPKSDDIRETVGAHYDLLAAFQTYFLYKEEIYQLSTFHMPHNQLSALSLKDVSCFLVLGNENLVMSRTNCKSF